MSRRISSSVWRSFSPLPHGLDIGLGSTSTPPCFSPPNFLEPARMANGSAALHVALEPAPHRRLPPPGLQRMPPRRSRSARRWRRPHAWSPRRRRITGSGENSTPERRSPEVSGLPRWPCCSSTTGLVISPSPTLRVNKARSGCASISLRTTFIVITAPSRARQRSTWPSTPCWKSRPRWSGKSVPSSGMGQLKRHTAGAVFYW